MKSGLGVIPGGSGLRLAAALLALAGLLAPRLAWADAQPFCVLQKVDVKQLANATVISLEADGLIQLSSDGLDVWGQDERGNWFPKSLDRISFTLSNVRAGAAPMVQVARYPVSHLEFALPPDETDNIGLRCTLVLYKPAMVLMFNGDDDSWDFGSWRPGPGPYVMISSTQKKDKVLITIISDRSEEPKGQARPAPTPAPSRLNVSGTAASLSVQALHADFADVIKQIGARTGQPILVDDPVNCAVTVQLEKMPVVALLGKLATAYGLCLSQVDNITHFSLSQPDSATAYWVGETRAIPLNYIPVQQALLLLPDVALPYVRRADDGNMLVVSGPPALVRRVSADVAALDRPAYQCRLQAWVLASETDDSGVKDLLASYAGGDTQLGLSSDGDFSVQTGTAHGRELRTELTALTEAGRLRAQRLPDVWCQSGESASLFVGDYIYYWRFRRSQDLILDRVQAGTQLTFAPRTDGSCVTAAVSIGSDWPGLGPSAPRYGPLVTRRSATTTVQLKSGGMLLIGGLRQGSTSDKHSVSPVLPFPADAIASGQMHVGDTNELSVLVQVDAVLTPPVSAPPQ